MRRVEYRVEFFPKGISMHSVVIRKTRNEAVTYANKVYQQVANIPDAGIIEIWRVVYDTPTRLRAERIEGWEERGERDERPSQNPRPWAKSLPRVR